MYSQIYLTVMKFYEDVEYPIKNLNLDSYKFQSMLLGWKFLVNSIKVISIVAALITLYESNHDRSTYCIVITLLAVCHALILWIDRFTEKSLDNINVMLPLWMTLIGLAICHYITLHEESRADLWSAYYLCIWTVATISWVRWRRMALSFLVVKLYYLLTFCLDAAHINYRFLCMIVFKTMFYTILWMISSKKLRDNIKLKEKSHKLFMGFKKTLSEIDQTVYVTTQKDETDILFQNKLMNGDLSTKSWANHSDIVDEPCYTIRSWGALNTNEDFDPIREFSTHKLTLKELLGHQIEKIKSETDIVHTMVQESFDENSPKSTWLESHQFSLKTFKIKWRNSEDDVYINIIDNSNERNKLKNMKISYENSLKVAKNWVINLRDYISSFENILSANQSSFKEIMKITRQEPNLDFSFFDKIETVINSLNYELKLSKQLVTMALNSWNNWESYLKWLSITNEFKVEWNSLLITSAYEEFKIKKLMSDLKMIFEPQWALKNIELQIKWSVSARSKLFHSDFGKILQVISNLVDISLHLTSKGKIWIEIFEEIQNKSRSKQETCLWVTLRDTSIGLDQKLVDYLLSSENPNEHKINADTTQGIGFNLYITIKLIESMSSSISIKTIKNIGSEYWVWFKEHSDPEFSIKTHEANLLGSPMFQKESRVMSTGNISKQSDMMGISIGPKMVQRVWLQPSE